MVAQTPQTEAVHELDEHQISDHSECVSHNVHLGALDFLPVHRELFYWDFHSKVRYRLT